MTRFRRSALAALAAVSLLASALVSSSPAAAAPSFIKGKPGVGTAKVASATTLATVNYFYGVGRQVITPATTSWTRGAAVNLHIENPYVDAADFHSIMELAVQSADGQQVVEIGWRKTPGDCPRLFGFHWINGVGQGYNVGITKYGTPAIYFGDCLSPANVNPVHIAKRFQITNGSNVWWLYYDGVPLGYINGNRWTTQGVTFDKANIVQAYGEVAASTTTPKTDMGNGLGASSGSSSRLGSAALTTPTPSTLATSLTFSAIPNTAAYTVSALDPTTGRASGAGYGPGGTLPGVVGS